MPSEAWWKYEAQWFSESALQEGDNGKNSVEAESTYMVASNLETCCVIKVTVNNLHDYMKLWNKVYFSKRTQLSKFKIRGFRYLSKKQKQIKIIGNYLQLQNMEAEVKVEWTRVDF